MAVYDIYDTQDLLELWSELRVSRHAMREAYKEGLHGKDIIYAIFRGQIIEHYPRRRRVLIAGPITDTDVPLHVVCDYTDGFNPKHLLPAPCRNLPQTRILLFEAH